VAVVDERVSYSPLLVLKYWTDQYFIPQGQGGTAGYIFAAEGAPTGGFGVDFQKFPV
jgi:hypothetical protein